MVKTKKIYESNVVDMSTGEVIQRTVTNVTTTNERFLFARTTEGLEWITKFRELIDLQLLMVLVEYQEIKSGVSVITKVQIDEIAKFFNKNERTIRNSLSRLVTNGFVHKVANCNYMVDPCSFYKGGSLSLKNKLTDWNRLKCKVIPNIIEEPNTNFDNES